MESTTCAEEYIRDISMSNSVCVNLHVYICCIYIVCAYIYTHIYAAYTLYGVGTAAPTRGSVRSFVSEDLEPAADLLFITWNEEEERERERETETERERERDRDRDRDTETARERTQRQSYNGPVLVIPIAWKRTRAQTDLPVHATGLRHFD